MTLEEKVRQLGAVWVTSLVDDGEWDDDRAFQRLRGGIGQVTRIGASTGLRPERSAELANAIQRTLVERTRLGIPCVIHEEGVAGYLARDATQFPHGLALAATWDPVLVEQVGGVIRAQMLAVGARHNLAPVLDVARDPRWGRVEETYGESPELCARMGVAYVRGVQTSDLRDGVVCTGKHFLGYASTVGGRNHAPAHIGPRELREVYAEPFAAAVREAGLGSMMNSYSSIDGVPVAASRELLTDLLRGELGFDGTVVADYYAVTQLQSDHHTAADKEAAAVQALSAGLDVELPSLSCYSRLVRAVQEGRFDEAVIDESCERVLAQKIRLGLFERPYVDHRAAATVFDTPDQRALARRAAAASIILIENDGVLPLDPGVESIAVVGPHADDRRLLQGDYHYPAHLEIITQRVGTTPDDDAVGPDSTGQLPEAGGSFEPGAYYTPHVTPLAGLRAALPGADIAYAAGCHHSDPDESGFAEAVALARDADVAVVCVGARSGLVPECTVGEARDATDLDLPGAQPQLVRAVAATGTPTVVVVISGRVHTLADEVGAANALLWSIVPGEEGGAAIADVLTGVVDPGGRLPVTLPRRVGQIPLHHDMRKRGETAAFYGGYVDDDVQPLRWFGEGLSYTRFEYGDLVVEPGTTSTPTVVAVEVTNAGGRDGDEVVQLYVTDEVSSVVRPIRELVGFARTPIAAGETVRVAFTVDATRLAFHGIDMRLITEPGEFTFRAGRSSTDPAASSATVRLDGPVAETDRRSIVATAVEVTRS